MRLKVYAAGAKLAAALRVSVEEPDPGAGRPCGEKLAVRPEGKMPVENDTGELKPPIAVAVRCTVALVPGARASEG